MKKILAMVGVFCMTAGLLAACNMSGAADSNEVIKTDLPGMGTLTFSVPSAYVGKVSTEAVEKPDGREEVDVYFTDDPDKTSILYIEVMSDKEWSALASESGAGMPTEALRTGKYVIGYESLQANPFPADSPFAILMEPDTYQNFVDTVKNSVALEEP